MQKEKPSVIFMGTPDFAVASLGALIMNGYDIPCVVTAPDKPAGRGRKTQSSPVKEFALHYEIPILQPTNLQDPLFIKQLDSYKADIFVVVAFRMLPKVVWSLPRLGTFNLHASLLPDYRGAAPINHAIINGEKLTGVTTFLIDEKIDTGSLLLQEKITIGPHENVRELHDRLMKKGASLVIRTIEGLSTGSIIPVPQPLSLRPGEVPKTAPKIYPSDCNINWNNEASIIYNFIRGLSPSPGARTTFRSADISFKVKILEARFESKKHNYPAGTISTVDNRLTIYCDKGLIDVLRLQPESKKSMLATDFLRGNDIAGFIATQDQA